MVDKELNIVSQAADVDSASTPEPASPVTTYGANKTPGTNKSFFAWFDRNDGPLERRVIAKLDFFILSYAFIAFWVST
jgi:hypothetical protein